MIRIAITAAAYRAIRSTLPEDELLWPVQASGAAIPRPRRSGRPRPSEGHA